MIWNLLPIKLLWLAPAGVIIASSITLTALMAGGGGDVGGESVLLGGLTEEDDLDAIFGASDDEVIFLEGIQDIDGESGGSVEPPRSSFDDEIDDLFDDLTDDEIDDLLDSPPLDEESVETPVDAGDAGIAEACEGSPTPAERRAACAAAIFNSMREMLGVLAVAEIGSGSLSWWTELVERKSGSCNPTRISLVAWPPDEAKPGGFDATFELNGLIGEASFYPPRNDDCGSTASFNGYWVQGPFYIGLWSERESEEALTAEIDLIMEYIYKQLAPYDGLSSTP